MELGSEHDEDCECSDCCDELDSEMDLEDALLQEIADLLDGDYEPSEEDEVSGEDEDLEESESDY